MIHLDDLETMETEMSLPKAESYIKKADNLLLNVFLSLKDLNRNQHQAIWFHDYYKKEELIDLVSKLQQATEFYLKASLININPFLILKVDYKSLPKNKDFNTCSTIDACDLINTVNYVYESMNIKRCLMDSIHQYKENTTDFKFATLFEKNRLLRNSYQHGATSFKDLDIKTISEDLFIVFNIFHKENFIDFLFKNFFEDLSRKLYLDKNINEKELTEMEHHLLNAIVFRQLYDMFPFFESQSNIIKKHLFKGNINKKRKYICPGCREYHDFEYSKHPFFTLQPIGEIRQLNKNLTLVQNKEETCFKCQICNFKVERKSINKCKCRSCYDEINVDTFFYNGMCLSCGLDDKNEFRKSKPAKD
jgi:hypothetical protein